MCKYYVTQSELDYFIKTIRNQPLKSSGVAPRQIFPDALLISATRRQLASTTHSRAQLHFSRFHHPNQTPLQLMADEQIFLKVKSRNWNKQIAGWKSSGKQRRILIRKTRERRRRGRRWRWTRNEQQICLTRELISIPRSWCLEQNELQLRRGSE